MKRKIGYTTGYSILLALFFVVLCQSQAKAVTRSEVLGNTTFYTNVFFNPQRDTVTIINSTGRNFGLFTSFFPKSSTQLGEAYVWGGTDDYYTFLNKITSNISAGGYYTSTFGTDTNQYWVPELSSSGSLASHYLTGIDCGVFANRCLGLNPYQGIAALQKCSQQITIDEMKPGDLCIIPHHIALNAEGSGSWIVHSVSSVSYGPPKVQQGVWDQGWGVFTPYSIFPQFSGIYPPPDTTLSISEDVAIELLAEGTKPSPKNNVVAEINNVKMWLDDSLVTPSVTGSNNKKTIKYKPNNLQSGGHYVKVQCENVVNGIAYKDTVTWIFTYGKPGWYDCYDNINGQYAYWLVLDNSSSYDLYFYEMQIPWNWAANLMGVDTLKDLHMMGIYDMPHWVTTSNDTFSVSDNQPFIPPISNGGYNISVDGKVISSIEGIHEYTANSIGCYWNRVLCNPTDLHNINIANPSKIVISYTPPVWPAVFESTIVYMNATGVIIGTPQLSAYASGSRPILWGEDVKTKPNVSTIRDDKVYIDETRKYSVSSANSLRQNLPNPVISSTNIKYSIETEATVTLKIYNLAGQLVKTLMNRQMPGGTHTQFWDGTDENNKKVSQGIYLYRITAGNYSDTKKLIILR